MTSPSLDQPISVEVIAYVPTRFNHRKHCEVTWQAVRTVVPLFDQEIRWLAMLDQASHALFA